MISVMCNLLKNGLIIIWSIYLNRNSLYFCVLQYSAVYAGQQN